MKISHLSCLLLFSLSNLIVNHHFLVGASVKQDNNQQKAKNNLTNFHGNNISLSLLVSKLYNYYDNDELEKAFPLAKRLMIEYPLCADAYFVFGDIHLKQKNYSTALDYLLIAERKKFHFFYKVQELELYLSLGTLYYYQNNITLQKEYFNRILKEVKKQNEIISVTESNYYLAYAYFFLGLQALREDNFFQSLAYFEQTIELNWNQKVCYFLLAYYLATKDINTINLSVERHQKGFFMEEEDQKKYFLNYYEKYLNANENHKDYYSLITKDMQKILYEYYNKIFSKMNEQNKLIDKNF